MYVMQHNRRQKLNVIIFFFFWNTFGVLLRIENVNPGASKMRFRNFSANKLFFSRVLVGLFIAHT